MELLPKRIKGVRCKVCNRTVRSIKAMNRRMGDTCYRKWKLGFSGVQITIFTSREELNNMKEGIKTDGRQVQK